MNKMPLLFKISLKREINALPVKLLYKDLSILLKHTLPIYTKNKENYKLNKPKRNQTLLPTANSLLPLNNN